MFRATARAPLDAVRLRRKREGVSVVSSHDRSRTPRSSARVTSVGRRTLCAEPRAPVGSPKAGSTAGRGMAPAPRSRLPIRATSATRRGTNDAEFTTYLVGDDAGRRRTAPRFPARVPSTVGGETVDGNLLNMPRPRCPAVRRPAISHRRRARRCAMRRSDGIAGRHGRRTGKVDDMRIDRSVGRHRRACDPHVQLLRRPIINRNCFRL